MFVCIIIIIIILFPCHIAKGTLQKKSVWKKSNAVNFDLFLEGVCQLKIHFSKPFYFSTNFERFGAYPAAFGIQYSMCVHRYIM